MTAGGAEATADGGAVGAAGGTEAADRAAPVFPPAIARYPAKPPMQRRRTIATTIPMIFPFDFGSGGTTVAISERGGGSAAIASARARAAAKLASVGATAAAAIVRAPSNPGAFPGPKTTVASGDGAALAGGTYGDAIATVALSAGLAAGCGGGVWARESITRVDVSGVGPEAREGSGTSDACIRTVPRRAWERAGSIGGGAVLPGRETSTTGDSMSAATVRSGA